MSLGLEESTQIGIHLPLPRKDAERWLTVPQAAQLLQFHPQTIRRATTGRELNFKRWGKGPKASVMIEYADLYRWWHQNCVTVPIISKRRPGR